MIQLIILLLFSAIWIGLLIYILIGWLFTTPFYPSRVKHLDKVFKDMDIKTNSQTKFIDLGSGDGRIVVWAAGKGMQAFGIELNPYLSLLSKLFIFISGKNKSAKIFNKSFYKHNYSEYDIVYLYIYKEHMDKLKDKLFSEMKPGSVIISNVFTFTNQKPDRKVGRFNIYAVK